MLTRRLSLALVLALSALGPAACSGAASDNAAGGGAPVQTAGLCDSDPRAMKYAAGMSQATMTGGLKVSLVDAMPGPPAENENVWTIKVTDANGDPVDGATISMKPWMPDMGHGSSVTPVIAAMSGGMYQVTVIDLIMPGIWTNTFTIKAGSAPATTAVFTFCIDG
jgi:hypothetical protein